MNFSTSNVTSEVKISPKFNVGWNQCKIEGIDIKEASTGSKQLKFRVYGPPITVPGFKAFKKADGVTPYHGQIGIVQTSYIKTDNEQQVQDLFRRVINPLAIAFGIKPQVDAISADSLEAFIAAVTPLFTDESLPYIWMNFNGQEYEKPGSSYPGYTLSFRNITNNEDFKEKTTVGTMKKLPVKEDSTPSGDLVF